MNLKESFRYQNFLDRTMQAALMNVRSKEHALNVTKLHKCSKANPDAADYTEEVTKKEEFFPNDDVIGLMVCLVEQREKLSKAISAAKQALQAVDLDIDAAVEANKFRQTMAASIQTMLSYSATTTVEKDGHDFKFNVNGDQVPYRYEVETKYEEAYNRETAKQIMRNAIKEADRVSAEIDAAMINTVVDYDPPFDVNDTFDDVMESWIREHKAS